MLGLFLADCDATWFAIAIRQSCYCFDLKYSNSKEQTCSCCPKAPKGTLKAA